MGFDLTRPLFLGAGVVALAAIVLIWLRLAPPLAPARARASLGLRALIVVLLTGALAGTDPNVVLTAAVVSSLPVTRTSRPRTRSIRSPPGSCTARTSSLTTVGGLISPRFLRTSRMTTNASTRADARPELADNQAVTRRRMP